MGSAVHSISMKVIAALTTLSILAAPAMSKNMGSINVKDYGEVLVCAPDWAAGQIDMHDNGFTMRGDSRLYFCNRAVDGWDANAYWQSPLMDKHFAYTLDLSNVGCHCNATSHLCSLTSRTPGLPTHGWDRMERMPVLGCAMMEDILPTWPLLMVAWSSQLLSGVVTVLTWAGWMA